MHHLCGLVKTNHHWRIKLNFVLSLWTDVALVWMQEMREHLVFAAFH